MKRRKKILSNGEVVAFELRDPESGELILDVTESALGIWGRLRDVEEITKRRSLNSLWRQLTEPMKDDLRRIVPKLINYLQDAEKALGTRKAAK